MSMSDPLGDMLTRIRNAQRARHTVCTAPASKLRANVLDALKREGFIRGFAAEELRPGVAQLRIELKYNEGEPVIKEITRVSKPGRRVYSKIHELPRNGSQTRVRLRCELTGRSRGNYRKFKLCRIALRDLASAGQIPGMVKASW